MQKNRLRDKLIAMILIFMMTFANFAFVSKAYASSITDFFLGNSTDTGSKNIAFDAMLEIEGEIGTSIVSDVNDENLAIKTILAVEERGYLKDGQIEIREAEEGAGTNFRIKEIEELSEFVQSIEGSKLYLQQLGNSESNFEIEIPIEYQNEAYFDETNLSKSFKVVFSGIYVTGKGEEKEVSKEVDLKLTWKDERQAIVSSEVSKYIDFGEGIIVQTKVTVDNRVERNTLPVKETELTVSLPKYNDSLPTNVYILANSTAGTNGKGYGETDFGNDNWEYIEDEEIVKITVPNEKQIIEIDTQEEDSIQDADREIVEEERYCNIPGVDEYLITYTYKDVEKVDEEVLANSYIQQVITVLGQDKEDAIASSENYEYSLTEKIGDIISISKEMNTEDISKAYFYTNKDQEKYIETTTIVNVSYKDIIGGIKIEDTNSTYVDKQGNTYTNNDIYYKQIRIARSNFEEILGEDGEVKISDVDGNNEITITSSDEYDDGNGYLVADIDSDYSKIKIETTSPVNEGNLVINNTKAIEEISLNKKVIAELEKIEDETVIKAKYNYVDEIVEVGTAGTEEGLLDTETRANLRLESNSLSTTELNTDFKMRIELNNGSDRSDIYGHTEFELEFPEYVKNIEITNCSKNEDDGLGITSCEANGRNIRIVIDGEQDGIIENTMTNGTIIEITANIEVDMFAPSTTGIITMRTTNAEATNYNNEGLAEALLVFSAPTGLVLANSIYNYNNEGTYLTSIRQGKKEGQIEIYAAPKVVTEEIVVMNNNNNNISNLTILGRFPYEGVRDILNDDNLGTTQNVRITRGLVPDEINNVGFKIYYSEKTDATRYLDEAENGWIENPESLENMKSYLIVLEDEEQLIEPEQKFKFTYEYEVPGDLPHNEHIFGTVVAFYRNLSEIAQINCQEIADLVGLTTGEGPEIDLQISTSESALNEYQEFDVVVKATNIGDVPAEDVKVTLENPCMVLYDSREVINGEENWEDFNLKLPYSELYEQAKAKGKLELLSKTLKYGTNIREFPYEVTKDRLEIGESIEFIMRFKTDEMKSYGVPRMVDSIPENISEEERNQYYKIGDEYLIYDYKKEDSEEIYFTSKVTAKDMENGYVKESDKILVAPAPVMIEESDDGHTSILYEGEIMNFYSTIRNENQFPLTNVRITKILPEELVFNDAYIQDTSSMPTTPGVYGNYNQETREIIWNIDRIEPDERIFIKTIVEGGRITNGLDRVDLGINTEVSADEIGTVRSTYHKISIGRPVLIITQEEGNKSVVKEGEKINYKFTIVNEGTVPAFEVKLTDKLPKGIYPINVSYGIDGKNETTKNVSSQEEVVVNTTLSPAQVLGVNVTAKVGKLDDNPEKVNYGTVIANNSEEKTSDGVTYIVEAGDNTVKDAKPLERSDGRNNNSEDDENGSSNTSSKYKVTGLAWFDEDRDGMRSSKEKGMSGLTVRLINGKEIVQTQTTDSNGKYTFSNVENGTYLVLFDYDTEKYKLTTYKKSGVASNSNSDFTSTEINQDGKTRQGAVTEQIIVSGTSVSGIDMGLVYADTFDLKIDKSITKVTTQTMKGTTTENYKNSKIVKTEIAAKNLTGAIVYVEYEITVSNIGDVSGFARKIVDYLPEGMTFNSSLGSNADWYTGSDGNLYTEKLANKELAKGESATLKLVLTRQMTEENTDVVSNQVEIYQDYNAKGIEDSNSKAGNKAQGENDMSSADIAIMVKTGEELIYFSVIATTATLGMIVVFVTYTKISTPRKKIIE